MKLIALAGGIGSGKSVVGRVLSALGLRVYDCDSRAKRLMDSSDEIRRRIAKEIAPEAIKDGAIDRAALASIVFADEAKLLTLNSIVHGEVIADIHRWARRHQDEPLLFVETAILIESGLQMHVDEVWLVEASESTRLARACRRDNASEESVRARMARQLSVSAEAIGNLPLRIIDNDGTLPILPQIFQLLALHGLNPSMAEQWKS